MKGEAMKGDHMKGDAHEGRHHEGRRRQGGDTEIKQRGRGSAPGLAPERIRGR